MMDTLPTPYDIINPYSAPITVGILWWGVLICIVITLIILAWVYSNRLNRKSRLIGDKNFSISDEIRTVANSFIEHKDKENLDFLYLLLRRYQTDISPTFTDKIKELDKIRFAPFIEENAVKVCLEILRELEEEQSAIKTED